MFIIHVIPIAKGVGKETLTYFSKKDIAPGSVVTVPLRKKEVRALVLQSEDAREAKSGIRSAGHTLKKIVRIEKGMLYTPAFLSACKMAAEYFAGTTGSVLHQFKSFTEEGEGRGGALSAAAPIEKSKKTTPDIALIEDIPEERISAYRRMIRESFAKKKSVFILIPEIAYAEKLTRGIKRGIEEYLYTVHSGLTPKKQKEDWNALLKETHPVVVVGTGGFLSLPRTDIGLFILDYESSRAYKTASRPFIDLRIFVRFLAEHSGAKLIFGSFPLRTETKYLVSEGKAREVSPFRHHIPKEHPPCNIIDMRDKQKKIHGKKTPSTISEEFITSIKKSVVSGKNAIVFATRRGLHGETVCADCGTSVLCPRCHASLTLHKASGTKSGNVYQCHTCGHTETARDTCKHCGSWRVTTLGVGIEHVEEVLKEHFPEIPLMRIDADTTNTPKKIHAALDTWQSSRGAVLLTTEIGLPYITDEAHTVAVASLDTILSFPDYRGNERMASILASLALIATHTFLVQTRHASHPVFTMMKKGSIAELSKEALKEREALGYPPFAVLIKITAEGSQGKEDIEKYAMSISKHQPLIYTGAPNHKGAPRTHMLLKVPSETWPHPEIIAVLKTLPPSVTINVDPESVL